MRYLVILLSLLALLSFSLDKGQKVNVELLSYFGLHDLGISADSAELAMKHYTKAIETLKCPAFAYSERGNLYLSRKDIAAALQDFNQSVKCNSHQNDAYTLLGMTYALIGDTSNANKHFNLAKDMAANKEHYVKNFAIYSVYYEGSDLHCKVLKELMFQERKPTWDNLLKKCGN